ncbi:MAG: hypothetical protein LBC75_10075 [Fibromonadaceae bacterium]|jgi:uncharacterized protein (TIGR02145 family)|nr:hypothetical protein [Fibromonadaceae bacterium]
MKTNRFLSLAAFFAMALTLFACSSDDPSPPPSVEPSSDSSGANQQVFCKLTAGTCSQMSLSTCMELVNAGAAQIVSNCTTEEPPPPLQSSSSNGVTIIGYCDYGPIQANGDGGCFPMATADDEANCAMWGKVVSSCGTAPSSNSVPSSSSNPPSPSSSSRPSSSSNSTTLSSSSSVPSSSSVGIFGYCDYGPITEYGGGCFAMATAADKANCELPDNGGKVVSSCPSSSSSKPSSNSVGSSSSTAQNTSCLNGTFTDPRDNKTYKCVKIGTQTWMAQNLNYCPPDGCYFVDGKRDTYGVLYPSFPGSVCPSGWHLPSGTEFDILIDYVGGSTTAGTKLKASGGWLNAGNGKDNYGFSALPGGYLDKKDNVIYNVGSEGYWWYTSTGYVAGFDVTQYNYLLISADNATTRKLVSPYRDFCSVRCIQD